jgi:hypothetical protein
VPNEKNQPKVVLNSLVMANITGKKYGGRKKERPIK